MIVIEPSARLFESSMQGEAALALIERCGRLSWQSEGKTTETSAPAFVRMLINAGHESVIEHVSASVLFIVDRGVSHELVRHRLMSVTQESTRYCDYNKMSDLVFIRPFYWAEGTLAYNMWRESCEQSEQNYRALKSLGTVTPQEARSVLNHSLKVEMIVTANLREWRHIFKVRAAKAAHPQMRQVMVPLLQVFKDNYPVVFDDVEPVF